MFNKLGTVWTNNSQVLGISSITASRIRVSPVGFGITINGLGLSSSVSQRKGWEIAVGLLDSEKEISSISLPKETRISSIGFRW